MHAARAGPSNLPASLACLPVEGRGRRGGGDRGKGGEPEGTHWLGHHVSPGAKMVLPVTSTCMQAPQPGPCAWHTAVHRGQVWSERVSGCVYVYVFHIIATRNFSAHTHTHNVLLGQGLPGLCVWRSAISSPRALRPGTAGAGLPIWSALLKWLAARLAPCATHARWRSEHFSEHHHLRVSSA